MRWKISLPDRHVLLRIVVLSGVVPLMVGCLFLGAVIVGHDIVSIQFLPTSQVRRESLVLLARDPIIRVIQSKDSFRVARFRQVASFGRTPVIDFLEESSSIQFQSNGNYYTNGPDHHVQTVDDYQAVSAILPSSPNHESSSFLDASLFQNGAICLGPLHCKSSTKIPSSFFGENAFRTTFKTRWLEGVYEPSNQTLSKNPAPHLKCTRPGVWAFVLSPLEALADSAVSWTSFSSTVQQTGSSSLPFRPNPEKLARVHHPTDTDTSSSPFWTLLTRPAMVLLVALQLGLAFCYWNYKVPTGAVAQEYSVILNGDAASNGRHSQVWRILSGATAHFEVWHLGVNMVSFYNLSLGLEGNLYSSIEFLGMNLSLIVLVGAVWLALQYFFVRSAHRRPTVGYSGVLFAWSVILTLQQTPGSQTCPLPFFEQACFSTMSIGMADLSLSFSWAPWVQLMVAQVLLPRVSWTGHLAGVLVGFAAMWRLLPYLAFPSIYWPLLHGLFLRFVCGIDWKQPKLVYRSPWFVVCAATLLTCSLVYSTGFCSPATVSFALWFLFDCYVDASEYDGAVVRAYVVATVLNLIAQSLNVATRLSLVGLSFQVFPLVGVVQWWQWMVYLVGLLRVIPRLTTSSSLSDEEPGGGGIFGLILGPLLRAHTQPTMWDYGTSSSSCLPLTFPQEHELVSTTPTVDSSLFPGTGHTLGGSSSSKNSNKNSGAHRSRIV